MIYFFNKIDDSEIEILPTDFGLYFGPLHGARWKIPCPGPNPILVFKVSGNLAEKDLGSAYNLRVRAEYERALVGRGGLIPNEALYRVPGHKEERRPYIDRLILDGAAGVSFIMHNLALTSHSMQAKMRL